jgi:hypothetical protein
MTNYHGVSCASAATSHLMVILWRRVDRLPCVGERTELVDVRIFIPQAAVERLDVAVIREFPTPGEVEIDSPSGGG